MPEPEAPSASSKSFFTQKVAGAPLVAWVAVAGLGVGGFLWWRHRQQAAAGNSTATSAAGAVPTAATSEELMAAGLYQPPDITYNVPSPNIEQGVQDVDPTGFTPGGPSTAAAVTGPLRLPAVRETGPHMVTTPLGNSTPTRTMPKYMAVTPWPTPTSTLWGISQRTGVPLARIEALNPQIKNPNLVYSGQSIRYA